MEYGTDTTRAIMGITFSADAARYPDIRFIWSHAGGTLPFLAGRSSGAARNAQDRLQNGLMPELKKFYYDLAGAANAGAIASLLQLVTPSQVLFGTDFPPGRTSRDVARAIAELPFFSPRRANRSNTLPIDRGRMRFNTPRTLDPEWVRHHFEWKRGPDGTDILAERSAFTPMTRCSRNEEAGVSSRLASRASHSSRPPPEDSSRSPTAADQIVGTRSGARDILCPSVTTPAERQQPCPPPVV